MAISSQGASVTFGGVSLSEPTNISVSGASCDVVDVTGRSAGRIKQFEPGDCDLGELSVEAFGGGLGTGNLGQVAAISVSGGGVSYSGQAIFSGFEFACSVGEATRFTYRFKMAG